MNTHILERSFNPFDLLFRNLFYSHHNLNDRINTNNYVFTDELSFKYNLLIPNYDLHNLSKINSNYVKS